MSRLCDLHAIADGGALALQAEVGGRPEPLVLVRRGDQVWAYRNRCPHFSVGLDYRPGEFSTYRGQVLMCAHHSALFRFEDGQCIEGPCEGSRLEAVPVRVLEGRVMLL
ncbi:Rieske (2Fe-2S) protein [Metapseudomonas furukawaii]|jgi:nitrite reductase/ring-hydroxylating ferredoxin subunit|uniref:Ferredoxin subunits of nitrite reductase and ring-hydroxylating dioxygenases n=1 Tax=Metapseudomonas furukawaii TaxID=1149133 RepID=A0AAD1C0F2_METFU|nr:MULTISPECIES: Rieske 2Fe-2S domain-containing protein [Pseudomonas]ELS24471.1 Rieske (2Fe-2S) region [Pseudomonas furukawaii]OWJ89402.1 4-nitrocatechol monooxygenase [Pseudomonas sp. A46]WAG81468.1 Rieske 2Fe-2S domain-containing protein [Pseudomonas furukawaii]BAU74286.1 ferredoxin subunits of nitrite reductase and ring-hydroxylating dioxygenases [Pseudomonas furukawaii]